MCIHLLLSSLLAASAGVSADVDAVLNRSCTLPTGTDNTTLTFCNATRFSLLVLSCVCTDCRSPYKAAGGLAERHCYTIEHCLKMDYCSDCGSPWGWLCDDCEAGWVPSAPSEGKCLRNASLVL